jgi:pyruvate dehydrogenase E2 component (dihydrolipoamide acetyltransferase)
VGMFGVNSFSAVINPPQACILAVGAGIPKLAVDPNDKSKLKTVTMVTVQLSADRRVVTEAVAGQFLQVFQSYLSDADTLAL